MGRSAYQYTVRDLNEARELAEGILKDHGFAQKTLRTGELVWQKGTGFLVSQQFISIYYLKDENKILIYAWIQGGFGVPGMGEKELEGLGMTIPRRNLARVIIEIENAFEKIRMKT